MSDRIAIAQVVSFQRLGCSRWCQGCNDYAKPCTCMKSLARTAFPVLALRSQTGHRNRSMKTPQWAHANALWLLVLALVLSPGCQSNSKKPIASIKRSTTAVQQLPRGENGVRRMNLRPCFQELAVRSNATARNPRQSPAESTGWREACG